MTKYICEDKFCDVAEYRRTMGTLFLTTGKEDKPYLYYYDSLGRRIEYHAGSDRALLAKIKPFVDDLKSEGLKYLKIKRYNDFTVAYIKALPLIVRD